MKNKIWYLSDLDNTLIYTKRKLEENKNYTPYYYKDNLIYSYIENNTLKFFKNIWKNKSIDFIPITARNYNSYINTEFYKNEDIPHFILNHGVEIYINKKLDKKWQKIMDNKYNNLNNKIEELVEKLKTVDFLPHKKIEKIKSIDGYYVKILWFKELNQEDSKKYKKEIIEHFSKIKKDYKIVFDGRTWFFKPKFLNKSYALEYLKNKYKPELLFGAGDSDADIDFIKMCDFQIIPKNAPINNIGEE